LRCDNEMDEVECGVLLGPEGGRTTGSIWLEGRPYFVKAVLDLWYKPEGIFYKVRADDGNLYILRQQTSTPDGAWDLISFRKTG